MMSDSDSRYGLALAAADASINTQRNALADLRARAATLLAAAAVATSFLGATALRVDEASPAVPGVTPTLDGWELIATGSFVALTLLVMAILLPWRWRWHVNATKLIRDYVEAQEPASIDEMHRDLALHYELNFQRNTQKLARLYWAFRLSCLLLALQVVSWIIDLGVA